MSGLLGGGRVDSLRGSGSVVSSADASGGV